MQSQLLNRNIANGAFLKQAHRKKNKNEVSMFTLIIKEIP